MSELFDSLMGIPMTKRRLIILSLTISFVLMGYPVIPKSFSQDITDDEIKAALVFKFPVYVRWPDDLMTDKNEEFRCCVLGNNNITNLLMQFDGEKVMEKTINFKKLSTIETMEDCHLLFISAAEKENLPNILKTIAEKPVLTVGDMKGFTRDGGIINFIRKKDSVHFEINPKAAERAGLEISSKLLRLAKIIDEE